MTTPVEARRNVGHPWTGEPGWDLLHLRAPSIERLDEMIDEAERKFWHVWIRDQQQVAAVCYKPAGQAAQWHEPQERMRGTPRGHGPGFKAGDIVYTDFSRRITRHQVVAVKAGERWSQTGCVLKVKPGVPGSGHLADDPGRAPKEYDSPWIDSAWFRKAA